VCRQRLADRFEANTRSTGAAVKRLIGNILATSAALVVGLVTVLASLRYLKEPQVGWNLAAAMDWSVLIMSGLMTGIITFMTIWGHFQKEPVVEGSEVR
jgi:hypothetical protein